MMMTCYGWSTKGVALFPLSEILTIANFRHAASRFWTCAKPEFKLWWMKLCSTDNHYTTAPLKVNIWKLSSTTRIPGSFGHKAMCSSYLYRRKNHDVYHCKNHVHIQIRQNRFGHTPDTVFEMLFKLLSEWKLLSISEIVSGVCPKRFWQSWIQTWFLQRYIVVIMSWINCWSFEIYLTWNYYDLYCLIKPTGA